MATRELVFGEYGQLYDLLYAAKDSDAEAAYVAELIERWAPGARTLLDLGCGTGRHGRRMAARGYDVVGVERSPDMLAAGRSAAPVQGRGRFEAVEGDACTTTLETTFDAVTALFHVVSYQTRDEQLRALLANVRRHVAQRGCFVFDVWHADAVLAQRPELRVLRRESDRLRLTRIAEPTLDEATRVVEVAYTVFVEDKATGAIKRLDERHRLRYFASAELTELARAAGLRIVQVEEWLSRATPSADTWGVCYVAVPDGAG